MQESVERLADDRDRGEVASEWNDAAKALAHEDRFAEAAAELEKAARLEPANSRHWYFLACVRKYLEDAEGYEHDCQEMLKRFGRNEDAPTAERTAKICLLCPRSGDELKQASDLAEQAFSDTTYQAYHSWFPMVKGLAEYRNGRHQRAIDVLSEQRGKMPEQSANVTVLLIMAMAHEGLGHHDQAVQLLRDAESLMRDKVPATPGIDSERLENWTIYRILWREANSVIAGQVIAPPARAKEYVTPPLAMPPVVPMDLLRLIDPKRDAVEGTWSIDSDGALVSDDSKSARLSIAGKVPQEYDFQVEFKRVEGDDSISQILSAQGHGFEYLMGGGPTGVTSSRWGKSTANGGRTRRRAFNWPRCAMAADMSVSCRFARIRRPRFWMEDGSSSGRPTITT